MFVFVKRVRRDRDSEMIVIVGKAVLVFVWRVRVCGVCDSWLADRDTKSWFDWFHWSDWFYRFHWFNSYIKSTG